MSDSEDINDEDVVEDEDVEDEESGDEESGEDVEDDSDEAESVAEVAPEPAPWIPAPTPVTDHLHAYRRFERLLAILEQRGALGAEDLGHIRGTP